MLVSGKIVRKALSLSPPERTILRWASVMALDCVTSKLADIRPFFVMLTKLNSGLSSERSPLALKPSDPSTVMARNCSRRIKFTTRCSALNPYCRAVSSGKTSTRKMASDGKLRSSPKPETRRPFSRTTGCPPPRPRPLPTRAPKLDNISATLDAPSA